MNTESRRFPKIKLLNHEPAPLYCPFCRSELKNVARKTVKYDPRLGIYSGTCSGHEIVFVSVQRPAQPAAEPDKEEG